MPNFLKGTKCYKTRNGRDIILTTQSDKALFGYFYIQNRPLGELMQWDLEGNHCSDPELDLVEGVIPRCP